MIQHITINGRFMHRWKVGEHNTVCGANPNYYPSIQQMLNQAKPHAKVVNSTANLHRCKRCY